MCFYLCNVHNTTHDVHFTNIFTVHMYTAHMSTLHLFPLYTYPLSTCTVYTCTCIGKTGPYFMSGEPTELVVRIYRNESQTGKITLTSKNTTCSRDAILGDLRPSDIRFITINGSTNIYLYIG